MPRTLFDKVWDAHFGAPRVGRHAAVLYVDLHLVHEVTSPQAFAMLRERGRKVRRPDLTVATMDHSTPTTAARGGRADTGHGQGSRGADRSTRDETAGSSASGCTPWGASGRGSCTSSGRSWG